MLAREVLACSGLFWLSVLVGLFAHLFNSMWRRAAPLRGLRGMRCIVSIGAFLARRVAASLRVLAWLFVLIDSPVTWRWVSSHVLLGLPQRRSSIFPEEFGSDVVFPLFAIFSIAGVLIADVVVVVTFVIAVIDPTFPRSPKSCSS